MSMVICPTCNTRVLPKLDGICPSCQSVIHEEAKEIKSKIDKFDISTQPKSEKSSNFQKINEIDIKSDNIVKNVRRKFWLKNAFISAPFIILIIFIILTIIGNTSWILIGPLILVAFGYAKLVSKTKINFKLLTFWVFVVFSGFALCLGIFLDIVFSSLGLPRDKIYLSPSTYIYIVFLLIGVCGLIYDRYNKR